MSSNTLYRKYRPAKFNEVVGQKHIVRTLSNAIENNRVGQAYLFTGPRGTGKTTFARIFAKTVNCSAPLKNSKDHYLSPCLKCDDCKKFQDDKSTDIIEIDAASNTGVDNIRELRETAKLSPLSGKYKIYIIDEVHMLSQGAFNALLKILEEPPKHIIFILATTEIHKVPETIISRCQRFDFSKFDVEEIKSKLSSIAQKEKISIQDEALELIALSAEGGMRDAESILEQIITLEKKDITAEKVSEILGISDNQVLEDLTRLIFNNQTAQALLLINKVYKEGSNLEFLAKSWLEYLRKIMLFSIDESLDKKIFSRMTAEQKKELAQLAPLVSVDFIIKCINKVSEAIPKTKESFIPQLPLETLIVELTHPQEAPQKDSFQKENPPALKKDEPLSSPSISKETTSPKPPIKEYTSQTAPENQLPEDKDAPEAPNKGEKINVYEIEKHWKTIIDELRKENCSLSMMLSNSKPIESADPSLIKIVIRHAFQKDLINKTENRLTIANISNKITELKFKVEAVTEEESGIKLKKILPEINPDMINAECATSSQESLLSDAMSLMGGKVVTE